MMKKLAALCAVLCMGLVGAMSASAMDSATLLQNPARYRVVSTQPDGVVYVDMDSIQAMQTRDYPNSIENISCKLYVETYANPLTAMDFEQNRIIRQINEYDAALHANKRDNQFKLDASLQNAYTPDGQKKEIAIDTVLFKQIKQLFINTSRLAHLPNQDVQ